MIQLLSFQILWAISSVDSQIAYIVVSVWSVFTDDGPDPYKPTSSHCPRGPFICSSAPENATGGTERTRFHMETQRLGAVTHAYTFPRGNGWVIRPHKVDFQRFNRSKWLFAVNHFFLFLSSQLLKQSEKCRAHWKLTCKCSEPAFVHAWKKRQNHALWH